MASINLSNASLTYLEDAAAVPIDPAALFDASGLPTTVFEGYELSAAIAEAAPAFERLSLAGTGVALEGRRVIVNGQEVGTFRDGISGSPLRISLNGNADATVVQTLIRALSYQNFADNLPVTSTRQISVSLTPPGSQTPAVVSSPRAVTVSGSADAPVVSQRTPLYNFPAVQITADNAAPGGPWFAYQDTVNYPDDLPLVGGTTFQGGSATPSQAVGSTRLETDIQAFAGFSNYAPDYSELTVPNLLAGDVAVTLEPVNSAFPVLDRQAGYKVSFSAQLEAQARGASADNDGDGLDDRAGFSAIVIGNDQKGIEIGFWDNEVWAQNDGTSQIDPSIEPDGEPGDDTRTLFTHGEGTVVNTSVPNRYDLVVKGDRYQLYVDDSLKLSGPLRDYSAFSIPSQEVSQIGITRNIGLPNPYQTPNFIFLGDNTPTASATVNLNDIAVSTSQATPQIQVSGSSAVSVPLIQLDDADGNNDITTVSLTPEVGRFNLLSNDNVTVRSITSAENGRAVTLLTGTLSNINQLLQQTTNASYTPPGTFFGPVPVEVAFDVTAPPLSQTKTDFNLDSFDDLLWYNTGNGATAYWSVQDVSDRQGSIPRGFLNGPPLTNWEIAGTADINGDGQRDVFWRNYETFDNAVWIMNGANRESSQFITTNRKLASPDWRLEATGNFDQDASVEFIWRNTVSGALALWELNGSDFVESKFLDLSVLNLGVANAGVFADPENWKFAATEDFDGDGIDDLLLRNRGGANVLWTMNGATVTTSRFLTSLANPDWEIIGAADYTRDGQTDVAWRNTASGANAVWEMDGLNRVSSTFLPTLNTNWIGIGT